jgi:hypothetical protein
VKRQRRNPIAKALRVLRPKIVRAKRGRGAYRRKGRSSESHRNTGVSEDCSYQTIPSRGDVRAAEGD